MANKILLVTMMRENSNYIDSGTNPLVEGFILVEETTWKKHLKTCEKKFDELSLRTNDEEYSDFEDANFKDYVDNFNTKEISADEAKVLCKLFNLSILKDTQTFDDAYGTFVFLSDDDDSEDYSDSSLEDDDSDSEQQDFEDASPLTETYSTTNDINQLLSLNKSSTAEMMTLKVNAESLKIIKSHSLKENLLVLGIKDGSSTMDLPILNKKHKSALEEIVKNKALIIIRGSFVYHRHGNFLNIHKIEVRSPKLSYKEINFLK